MGVKPMDAILHMREMAIEAGLVDTQGAKHALAFYETVMEFGKVNEAVTAVNSLGVKMVSKNVARIFVGGAVTGKRPAVLKERLASMAQVDKLRLLVKESRRKRHG